MASNSCAASCRSLQVPPWRSLPPRRRQRVDRSRLRWLSCLDGSPTCCLVTGSRRSPSAPIPTARATCSPRWCAAASPTRPQLMRCCSCTGSPTTSSTPSWPTTLPPSASRSTPLTWTNAAVRGETAKRRTSPPIWHATTPSSSVPSMSSTRCLPRRCLVYGHSAGGLIVSLWLDRLHSRGATQRKHVAGLVLNSPWLDLQGPAILRTPPTGAALRALSRFRARTVVRPPTEGGYGTTLHRDYAGDFDYDLKWKPIGGFPVTFGWITRHPARARQTAQGPRRRCAEPHPAVGPQCAGGAGPGRHPAWRRCA